MYVWSLPPTLSEPSSVELGIKQIGRIYFQGLPFAEVTMARIAALSGEGSLFHAVTTRDSWGHVVTFFRESCAEFPMFSTGFAGFESPLSPPVFYRGLDFKDLIAGMGDIEDMS